MAVIEVALLHFKAEQDPSVTEALIQAQKAQEEHSKHKVRFLRQIEDPSCFYLMAGWESLERHSTQSIHYQGHLVQLADRIEVDWMFHLDADPSTFAIPFDAPVIAIGRYFVEASKKEEFTSILKPIVSGLADTTKKSLSYCSAWRIDKGGEDEEFVFFSGWKDIADHIEFAKSEAAENIAKLSQLVKGVEVKHACVQKWE
ncbi:hypothetical protein N7508_001514 [Penicillium antarcticum]|uniref:uncharacterized protein n=1 Tax=Penicillium antarcticum TaxID=416450 RepID=UPI002397F998|nr:uncharacterized protein N7508_001514 [Penicillium antarcticum]KAJ5317006.1 hypothetical protein N7508_001514 [Penicillium antarcticum]